MDSTHDLFGKRAHPSTYLFTLAGTELDHQLHKQVEPEETGASEEPAIHTDMLLVVTPFHFLALQIAPRGVFMTKHVTSCDSK